MGGSTTVKETESQKAQRKISQADWDIYQNELKQATTEYLSTVEDLVSLEEMKTICKNNNINYQAVFEKTRQNNLAQMQAKGIDPSSPQYQRELEKLQTNLENKQATTTNISLATQQDKHIAGQQDALAIGNGEKATALASYSRTAEQELNRAINDAEESRQQRASTMGGVLDLASAGMAYGKDYLTKSATEKATEQINAGGTGSGLSDMQERYPTSRPASYGNVVYGNK